MSDHADYTSLDDSTLIARRREIREQLEDEPPNMAELVRTHHLLTTEVLRRTISLRRQHSDKRPPGDKGRLSAAFPGG